MADEINTGGNGVVAETAQAPVTKKQRAPRGQKKAAEQAAAASASTSEKVAPRTRKKRGEAQPTAKRGANKGQATVTAQASEPVAKAARKTRAPKTAQSKATVSVSASDDLVDLIRLEEENKKLRKDLAEKLRGENADLRKRLGLA
jgi:putative transposase